MNLRTDERECERRRLPMAERLEPRVLYSADALGGFAPFLDVAAADDDSAEARAALLAQDVPEKRFDAGRRVERDGVRQDDGQADDPPGSTADEVLPGNGGSPPDAAIGSAHVVFVDAAVPGAGELGAALAHTGATLVTIGAEEDGLLVISRTLASHDSLAAVHIVSHGAPGALALGTATLDEAALGSNGAGIARWGEALRANGDLLVYGCDAGAGEIGERFVNALATLTGADVAASDDPTGHAALGGDWTLERASGAIEADGVDTAFAVERWRHLLDEITITSEGDGMNVPYGTTMAELKALQDGGQLVTLREAMHAAWSTAGDDTITLGTGSWTLDLGGDGEGASRSGDLDVREGVTLRGAGSGDTSVTMTGGDKDRLFDVDGAGSLTLEGLTLSGGEADEGGAIRVNAGGTLIARDVVIEDSEATGGEGGGIYNAGETTLENVTVRDNTAAKGGGGTSSATGAQLSLDDVRVIGNVSSHEGGGGIDVRESLTATDLVMRDNVAAKNGGALHAHGDATIVGGLFANNSTSGGKGGAIEIHGEL